jgi:hypothetical protein
MFNLKCNAMKKVVLFLSFALLSSFLVVAEASTTTSDVKTSENAVREQLASVLSNVTFENGSEVTLIFSVSSEKGFELLGVNGKDAELIHYVKKELSSKSIAVPSNLEGKYSVTVKFTDVTSL